MKTPDGYLKPRELPNRDGFKFVGLLANGDEIACTVKKDDVMLAHYVTGAKYCDLIGWRKISNVNCRDKPIPGAGETPRAMCGSGE